MYHNCHLIDKASVDFMPFDVVRDKNESLRLLLLFLFYFFLGGFFLSSMAVLIKLHWHLHWTSSNIRLKDLFEFIELPARMEITKNLKVLIPPLNQFNHSFEQRSKKMRELFTTNSDLPLDKKHEKDVNLKEARMEGRKK